MSYDYAGEYHEVIPLLPDIDFKRPTTARKNLMEAYLNTPQTIDETGVTVKDLTIRRPDDDTELQIRLYTPDNTADARPGILNIHGGGFVIGSLENDHPRMVHFCKELGTVIVSVEYRLAPEHPYPAGLEDCYLALEWMLAHREDFNLDQSRVAVMGQSGGGGLAASLALLVKQRGHSWISFQYLGIPEVDDRLDTVSMREFTDTPLWWHNNAVLSWKYYLGDQYSPGASDVPATAAPARADIETLKGLPPAYVTTMAFDPLRDEGILYALKLMQAGVSVELHSYPHTFHASTLFVTGNSVGDQAAQDELLALRRGLNIK